MKNDIPKAVLEAAKDLVDRYGDSIEYLGKYQEDEAYMFVFPQDEETGFPFVFLYDRASDQAMTISGFDALDILSSFG